MYFKPRYLLIALGILIIEILIATIFAGYPFIRGSLGDMLVVILLFFLLLAFVPIHPLYAASGIFLFACSVEVAQYLGIVDVLGISRSSVLGIIIGTTFSWEDILMYAIGCVAAVVVQRRI